MATRRQQGPKPSIEQILACQSLDQLRSIAKLAPIRSVLQDALDERYSRRLKLNFRSSWKNLFDAMRDVRSLVQDNSTPSHGSYFMSEEARIIYSLLELDGENRTRALNVPDRVYSNPQAAKDWYRTLAKRIHPDTCKHPLANDAFAKLHTIYEQLVEDW